MKNKNKIHIHLVNYICIFLILCISLCYYFKKNIPYKYFEKCLKSSYLGNIGMHMHMNHFKEVQFPNDSKWMHPNGF
jgi:hypothetical protein